MTASPRSLRVGILTVLGAVISAMAFPLAAHAVQSGQAGPVGEVTLIVTDCKTGAPITAGEANAFIPRVGGGVAPIVDGQAGPFGIGEGNFVLIVTSPGYRELYRVLKSSGDESQSSTISLCLHPVADSPETLVTTTYDILINCSPTSGQLCNPPYTTSILSNDIMNVQFVAASSHCSSIIVAISVDGSVFTSDPLGPGQSTPVVAFTPVSPGIHAIAVQATGIVGGCNAGTLVAWAGTLTVTTSMPFGPVSREACKDGGWMFFTDPPFKSEGDCVSYASTAGTNPAG